MTDEKRVYVSWFDCNCEWRSKYCDEYHKVGASVPENVLNQYNPRRIEWSD